MPHPKKSPAWQGEAKAVAARVDESSVPRRATESIAGKVLEIYRVRYESGEWWKAAWWLAYAWKSVVGKQPTYRELLPVATWIDENLSVYMDADDIATTAVGLYRRVTRANPILACLKAARAQPAYLPDESPRLALLLATARNMAEVFAHFALPQKEIAFFMGVEQQHVSRLIGRMVIEGWIEVADGDWSYTTHKAKLYRLPKSP
ncbi:MAG: winged helix-turn-helix domain-containing protein [Planctomycetes bacterium]|nr:winged helix-turn-helix domain-containing protein [Planctomycetota bacterium]